MGLSRQSRRATSLAAQLRMTRRTTGLARRTRRGETTTSTRTSRAVMLVFVASPLPHVASVERGGVELGAGADAAVDSVGVGGPGGRVGEAQARECERKWSSLHCAVTGTLRMLTSCDAGLGGATATRLREKSMSAAEPEPVQRRWTSPESSARCEDLERPSPSARYARWWRSSALGEHDVSDFSLSPCFPPSFPL